MENVLPLCELYMRCTNHTKLKLSPFEVVFGRKMPLGLPFDLSDSLPKLTWDQLACTKWLQHRLKDIHKAVAENLKDTRQDMKTGYDRRHKVQEATWKVDQKVLLLDKRVNPGAARVLTHRPYCGPFSITQCLQGDKFGVAYKLVYVETGRVLKSLINGDRLKLYTVDDRDKLIDRLPGIKKRSEAKVDRDKTVEDPNLPRFEPALRIVREKGSGNSKLYLVVFADNSRYWCSEITPALLQEYRVRMSRRKRERRNLIY